MEILIGNELTSGAAVYLSAEGRWVEELQQARLFGKDDTEARDAAIAASGRTHLIVGVAIEKVALVDGRLEPERLRERIRAYGPTTPRMDRQHLGGSRHVSI